MQFTLFLALASVYGLGIAGLVASGWLITTRPEKPELGSLEDRLAVVRTEPPPIPRHREPAS